MSFDSFNAGPGHTLQQWTADQQATVPNQASSPEVSTEHDHARTSQNDALAEVQANTRSIIKLELANLEKCRESIAPGTLPVSTVTVGYQQITSAISSILNGAASEPSPTIAWNLCNFARALRIATIDKPTVRNDMEDVGIDLDVVRPAKMKFVEALFEECGKLGRLEIGNYLAYVLSVASSMREGLELEAEKQGDCALMDDDVEEHLDAKHNLEDP